MDGTEPVLLRKPSFGDGERPGLLVRTCLARPRR